MSRLLRAAAVLMTAGVLVLIFLHLKPVQPESRVLAPTTEPRGTQTYAYEWPHGTIDPNTASPEELTALPGVGPAIAERIAEERALNGPFAYPEDLLSVKGIGQKTLQKLVSQLCFD